MTDRLMKEPANEPAGRPNPLPPFPTREGGIASSASLPVSGRDRGRGRATHHFLVALLVAALWLLPSAVLACPACKDALEGDAVGRALSWTTLLMIAVPMVLVGSIGGWI